FNNNGTFDAKTDQTISATGAPVFNNAGTFKKSAGACTTTVGGQFANAGTVALQPGTTTFNGFGQNPGATGGGTWAVAAAATRASGGSAPALGAGASVSGAGAMLVTQGTLTLGGAYSLPRTTVQGGRVNFDAPATTTTLSLANATLGGGGNVTVTGLLTWTSGTMTGTGTTFANGG